MRPNHGPWPTNIGLPQQKGVKTARACSHRLLSSREALKDAIDEAALILPRAVDFRDREQAVRRLAQEAGWHRAWTRQHHPGSPASSQRYAVAWLWTEYAAGHIDTSPGWETILDRNTRTQYRRYAHRLSQKATGALLTLVSTSSAPASSAYT